MLAALASPARAWQIESPATTGCHERITARAIRLAGFPGGAVPPAPSDYDQRVIRDVPFSFPIDGSEDPWNLALLVGVRNNDIEGNDPTDVAALSKLIHQLCTDTSFRSALATRSKTRGRLFSWRDTARQTLAVYERAVALRR